MYRVHPQPTPDQWSKALREIQELDGVSIPGDAWATTLARPSTPP